MTDSAVATEIDLKKYSEDLYAKVKANFPDDTLNALNVLLFVRMAMEQAEKFKELEGRQKKEVVIRVMHVAFDDYAMDEQTSAQLKVLVDFFIDQIIDNFVDINLGNLGLNKKQQKKFNDFFRKITPCCYKE